IVAAPLLAWATRGRFYLARPASALWRPGETVACTVCENRFESEDMASCPAYGAPICSLCCTLESRCHDRCKSGSRFAEQLVSALAGLLPARAQRRVNFRVVHYAALVASLGLLLAAILGVVYFQESRAAHLDAAAREQLRLAFEKAYAILMLVIA